jgi:hypothetical protein
VIPQPVLAPPASAASYLFTTIDPGCESVTSALLASCSGPRRAIGFRAGGGRLASAVLIQDKA